MLGGALEEMTEYRTMPRVPKAMANKKYAVTKAQARRVQLRAGV
jgi:hypothetical protein